MRSSDIRIVFAMCFTVGALPTIAADSPQTAVPPDSRNTALSTGADRVVGVNTDRPGVKVPLFYMKRPGATATVLLMPGGNGGFGYIVDGKPNSTNFLVRSRDFFAAAGFNVAVVQRVMDKKDLTEDDRVADEHMADLKKVVEYVKKDTGLPVWMVGTSMGTISTTAAAIKFGSTDLAGIVLTASIVSYKMQRAVPRQDLEAIKIPVLVLHHETDNCVLTLAHEAPNIIKGLKNAPIKKLVLVNKGTGEVGDPCQAISYHGFIGMEKEAVGIITDWIKQPTS